MSKHPHADNPAKRWHEVRSAYGLSWHLVGRDQSETLCGLVDYDRTALWSTDAEIEQGIAHQHEGWHYCASCLTQWRANQQSLTA